MFIGIDTSGPLGIETAETRTPGVAAAVVTPKRHREAVNAYVAARCRAWKVPELHAVHLNIEQLQAVCTWMGAEDRLAWTAALTDSVLFPPDQLCDWRENQANELLKAVDGRSTEEIETVLAHRSLPWHLARIRANGKVGLPSTHFVEFLFVLPRVIGDAVQTAIDAYDGPTWADEFDQLTICIDDSTASKAKTQLKDLLKPILSGPSLALRVPKLGGSEHPLFAKHQRDGRTGDLRSLIGDRIEFVDSKKESLCQLADIVAWTLRRAADLPHDPVATDLHRRLRPRQHGIEGSRGIRLMSARGVPDAASHRYQHVAARTRCRVPERRVLTP